MDKYKIAEIIENIAPLETQEQWDCSGWGVDVEGYDEVRKLMLCLTVTDDVIEQAKKHNCDMIISHHPCFYIPFEWSCINIYCAHTNLDKANGGTTDTLIETLGLSEYKIDIEHEFLRIIDYKTTVQDFNIRLKQISSNTRIINNKSSDKLNRIAFCAGSGSEFIKDAKELGADCLVTGDLKFHTALESPILIYDIGHFESEILILPRLKNFLGNNIEILFADEKSPFNQI